MGMGPHPPRPSDSPLRPACSFLSLLQELGRLLSETLPQPLGLL